MFLFFLGFVQSSLTCPMELTKIQLQSQGEGVKQVSKRTYNNIVDCLKKIYRAEGIRGLYRGMGVTVIREVPAYGIYFTTYEYFCRLFTPEHARFCPAYGLLAAGGIAGFLSWLPPIYSLDVLKTRIQQDGRFVNGRLQYKYTSYMHCIRQSLTYGGYRVFLRGLQPTLARAFVTNAAIFPVYTLCIRYLRPGDEDGAHREGLETCTIIAQREG